MADWTPTGPPRKLTTIDIKKWKATGAPQPIQFTPEQRYERGFNKLPRAARLIAPSTIGELGNMAGTAAGLAGIALAPETFGTSAVLAAPLLGAAAGGALEDPKHRYAGALWETGKAALGEAGGALATKFGVEIPARFLAKTQMLQKTAQRISDALPQLFSGYPLPLPNTARELENQIPSGQLADAFGARLGKFRDQLKKSIAEYKAPERPRLIEASSGQPFRYTQGKAASGVKFKMPDIVDDKVVLKDMSIGEAIDHVKSLQAAGWSSSGTAKSAKQAWLERQTAHDAREMLIAQLNSVQPGFGNMYGEMSGDYGAAIHLQKVFRQSYREDGELDQPALLNALRNEIDDINHFKGFRKGTQFRESVAPAGAMAQKEMEFMGHVHGGMEGPRWRSIIPKPYKPESRKMIPQPWRALSSNKAIPVVGVGSVKGAEDVLGEE